jgi:hypothetical protein
VTIAAVVAAAAAGDGDSKQLHAKREGGEARWPPLLPRGKGLLVEAVVIALLLALAAFLIYHFTVHTIRNSRSLGGLLTSS